MSRSLPLIAAVLLVSGCPSEGTRPGAPIDVTRITPEAPAPVAYSRLAEPLRTAVFDATTFAELWNRAFGGRDPAPPPPAVDFSTHFVVFAALGERSSGGYAIEVTGAVHDAGGVLVGVLSTAPGKDCAVTLAMTQPLDVVRIRRPATGALPVRFEERLVTKNCGP